jgi:hypothetical protein
MVFTDAQAAIKRMASEEPGPGQVYVVQARKHIAALRRARPGTIIEIRWCPAHKGVPGNGRPTSGPSSQRKNRTPAGWSGYGSPIGRESGRCRSPDPLAHLNREISEKKWAEARRWVGGRVSGKKYNLPNKQRPDGTVAGSSKRLASRFCQLKTGHCLTGPLASTWSGRGTAHRQVLVVPVQNPDMGALFKDCPTGRPSKPFCGRRC